MQKTDHLSPVQEIHPTSVPTWGRTLAVLLPLWLFSLAVMAEGFPRSPVPLELAVVSFALAILLSIFLIWKGWLPPELILYSLIPLLLLYIFDEISTRYKTPFILVCALILTLGIIAYRSRLSTWLRWLILLAAAAVTLWLAVHAADEFWQMTAALGYKRCFPDAAGCPPMPADALPWWRLFFGL